MLPSNNRVGDVDSACATHANRHMLKNTSWWSCAAVAIVAACGQVMTTVSRVNSAMSFAMVANRAKRQDLSSRGPRRASCARWGGRSIPIICIRRKAFREVAIPSRSR